MARIEARIPDEINKKLDEISEYYGLTRTEMIKRFIVEEWELIQMENDNELKKIIKGTYEMMKKDLFNRRVDKMKNFKIMVVNCNISDDIEIKSEDYKNMEDLLFSINMIISETKTLSFEEDSDFYGLKMLKDEITESELNEAIEDSNITITIAEKEDRDYCVYIRLGWEE